MLWFFYIALILEALIKWSTVVKRHPARICRKRACAEMFSVPSMSSKI